MTLASPEISVVICSYSEKRWEDLSAAVDSVQRQTLIPREIIIVVDHNPFLSSQVRRFKSGVRVVENQGIPGANGARNAGMESALGSIVAFLDDDAVAAPDWLERLLEGFRDPQILGIGGMAKPHWHAGQRRPAWFPEEFNWVVGCSYRGMPKTTTKVRNVFSCNMAIRREVWAAIGGFRHGIGHVGGQPRGDDETEFCIRLRQRWPQRPLLYEPRAKVYHHVPASRANWRYFRSRCWLEGRSKALLSRIVGSRDGLATERAYTLRTLPEGIIREFSKAILHGDLAGITRAAAIVAGLSITTAGFLSGSISRGRRAAWATVNESPLNESQRNEGGDEIPATASLS